MGYHVTDLIHRNDASNQGGFTSIQFTERLAGKGI